MYIDESKFFKCRGVTGVVECEVEVIKCDKPISILNFAIAKTSDVDGDVKFNLYPRESDNSGWLSNVVLENDVPTKISMYQSDKITDKGIKIKDLTCFNQLVALFQASKRDELIYLKSDLAEKPTARIIGDLVFAKSELVVASYLTAFLKRILNL